MRRIGYSFLIVLAGCNSVNELFTYEPVIDPRGVNLAFYEMDLSECRELGDLANVATDTATSTAGGAVLGGAVGAAVGNSDTAKRGAGVGAILGGVRGYQHGSREEERIIRRCLAGRGYRVLN